MAIIDNTLAANVDTFNPATPLAQASQIKSAQIEQQQQQFKLAQAELGSEARGLQPYVNSPEFPQRWAETADRLYQKGVLNEQSHQQWRNSPSPLMLKSIIAQTEDPTLSFRKQEAGREQGNTDRQFAQTQQYQNAQIGIQRQNADNNTDYTPEELSARRLAQLNAAKIDPESSRGKSYLLNGTDSGDETSKPIPFETLSGTKFLVRDKSGGYSTVDPSSLGGAQAPPTAAKPVDGMPAQAAADIESIDSKTGRREGYLQSLDPQVRDYVRKIANYEIDPRTTSVKGGMREKLLSAVSQYDPTYNQNDFGSRAKAIKDFGTGAQGNIVRSFDVAIDHLDTLDKAAKAMHNGDLRVLNEIRNKWREQTGSDLPTNFKALVPIVSGEIAKAVIGSQNALADREEMRAPLNAASSPEQLSGAIGAYKALMGGQLKGLKKQYEESTGKKDFDSRIRDTTRQVLGGEKLPAPDRFQQLIKSGATKQDAYSTMAKEGY